MAFRLPAVPRLFRLPAGTQPADVRPDRKIISSETTFFGPLEPIQPIAPPGTKPRQFNYEVGSNVIFTPRSNRIPAATLRNLADAWPLLRLVIETAKGQILRVDYDIGPKPIPGQKPSRIIDPKAEQIKAFFAYPDGIHTFREWLSMLLEDVFVIDAAVTYFERDVNGRIASLRQLDGANIKRLIDPRGVTPAPPQPAYQQLVEQVPSQDFTADDLQYGMMYERVNHLEGFPPTEQLLLTINQGLRRDVMRLGHYTTGNMPEMLVMIQDAPIDKIEKYQEYINSMLAGNLQRRNQAVFLPSAGSGKDQIVLPKQGVLADEYDDYLVRLVCYAYSVSPSALQKPMNRASAEQVSTTSEEEGLLPKLLWVEDYLNKIIQLHLGYTDYEFRFRTTRDPDELKQAQTDKIYLDSGAMVRNEIRRNLGLDPIDIPEMDMPGITTATGFVPLGAAPSEDSHSGDEDSNDDDPPPPSSAPAGPAEKSAPAAESMLSLALARAFNEAEERVGRSLAKADKLTPEQRAALLASALREVEITWDYLPGITEPLLAEAALKGVADGAAQAGAFVGFREVQDQARAWAKERAAEMVGKKYVDGQLVDNPDARYAISDTTREELHRIFSEEANLAPADFLKAIQNAGTFSEDRARLIAKTELKTIGQRSQYEGWRKSGKVSMVKWHLSSVGIHCPLCIANAEQGPVPLNKAFSSGHEAPPAHPRCGCYLTVAEIKKTGFAGRKHTAETKARIAQTMKIRRAK